MTLAKTSCFGKSELKQATQAPLSMKTAVIEQSIDIKCNIK